MNYRGDVLDEGQVFASIETDGPMVVLKITFDGGRSSAVFDIALSNDQAREIARHLIAAALTCFDDLALQQPNKS